MPRILLLIILIWILLLVLKRFRSQFASKKRQAEKYTYAEEVVPCNHCGLHIPESESTTLDGLIYCKNPKCQPLKNTNDN